MDGRTIASVMVAIDEELAVLNRRRQLLSELLTTFQIAPPPAEVEADRPKKKLAPKTTTAKWDYNAVAAVAKANDMSAAEVGRYFGVTADMGRYLIRQCRTRGLLDAKSTPKPPPTPTVEPKPERFAAQDVASMLGGVA